MADWSQLFANRQPQQPPQQNNWLDQYIGKPRNVYSNIQRPYVEPPARQGVYSANPSQQPRPSSNTQVSDAWAMLRPKTPVPPNVGDAYRSATGQAVDRAGFATELQDPELRQRLAAITHREVGGQGPQAQQAFLESVFNRAAARGKTLAETISGRDGYFPNVSLQPVPPQRLASYAPIVDTVANGSNLSNGATGNASGTVGFAGGPQTYAVNGERFGREGPDRNWKIPYRQGPDDAFNQPYRPVNNTDGAGWRDAPPMTGQFSTYQGAAERPAPVSDMSGGRDVKNAFQPQWNHDGSITWGDGTRQQVSAFG